MMLSSVSSGNVLIENVDKKQKPPTDADYLMDVKVLNKNSSPNWNSLPAPKNKKNKLEPWNENIVCTKHHVR